MWILWNIFYIMTMEFILAEQSRLIFSEKKIKKEGITPRIMEY